jgi:hypothetical protein
MERRALYFFMTSLAVISFMIIILLSIYGQTELRSPSKDIFPLGDCPDRDEDGYLDEDCGGDDCFDSYFLFYVDGTEACSEDTSYSFSPPGPYGWIADHSVVYRDGFYHIFYHHYDNKVIYDFMTPDFVNWGYHQDVIDSSLSETDWDDGNVWAPYVYFNEDDGMYYMFYTGVAHHDDGTPDDYSQRIGLLISSDLVTWERAPVNNCPGTTGDGCVYDCRNPWTTHGIPGGWNDQCRDPFILKDGDRWLMYNTIKRSDTLSAGVDVSESSDLINWNAVAMIEEVDMGQAENVVVFDVGPRHYLLSKCWESNQGECETDHSTEGINYFYSEDLIDGYTWGGSFDNNIYNAPEITVFEDGTHLFSGGRGLSSLYFKRLEVSDEHEVSFFNNFNSSCSVFSYDINPGMEEACDDADNNCNNEVDEGLDCFLVNSDIDFVEGWNLISIPLDVTSGLEVFSESGADSVLSFDGNWEYWINGEGDLVELGFGRGYFVHSNSDMSLSFEGHEPISEVVVSEGLSLIGVGDPMVVSDLVADPGLVNGVWEYDPVSGEYVELNLLDVLQPKNGYWISYGDVQLSPPLPPG